MAIIRTIAGYLALSIGLGGAIAFVMSLPPHETPWGDLTLDQPIGPFTDAKLAGLRGTDSCQALLEDSDMGFTALPDQSFAPSCGFEGVVNIEQSVTPYSAPVRITCPAAAALYLWERDIVQPAAEAHFGAGVSRIEHYGTYNCRRVNGRATGRFSEHATANAIDIAAFRLESGQLITVQGDWDEDAPEGRFLHEIRDGACKVFRTVLSPDYNAAHAHHFHLDMGRFDICR